MVRTADLKNMDVDALLALRGEVERAPKERARDLERQIALLGGRGEVKLRGRPPAASAGRGTWSGAFLRKAQHFDDRTNLCGSKLEAGTAKK